jgi:hypothetical protein
VLLVEGRWEGRGPSEVACLVCSICGSLGCLMFRVRNTLRVYLVCVFYGDLALGIPTTLCVYLAACWRQGRVSWRWSHQSKVYIPVRIYQSLLRSEVVVRCSQPDLLAFLCLRLEISCGFAATSFAPESNDRIR